MVVQTPHGTQITVVVPAGTAPGQQITVSYDPQPAPPPAADDVAPGLFTLSAPAGGASVREQPGAAAARRFSARADVARSRRELWWR